MLSGKLRNECNEAVGMKKTPQPSSERKLVWISAGKSAPTTDDIFTVDGGKWLIFRMQSAVDADWRKIEAACDQGILGVAKVSTRHPSHEHYRNKHVICVYADNPDDGTRQVLRDLGFVEKLNYKTDQMTFLRQRGSTRSD
jgi:hypothetical protein